MTKTVPERFAEIIELLILAIEAHLLGSYLPNRLAAPLSWRVRSSLEGISNSFAEAFAKFLANAAARAAEPPPEIPAQAPAEPRITKARSNRTSAASKRRRAAAVPSLLSCAGPNRASAPATTYPPMLLATPKA